MSRPQQMKVAPSRQQRILDSLQAGRLTWDQLRAQTKINEEGLGLTLGELLNQRKIWTAEMKGVRVYGLERRIGLVPRFAHVKRRADDLHV